MHINSPGGTTSGSEELYDLLMRLRESKPTVVVVDGLAASGGYIAALGGDHIIAARPRWSARSACCSSIRTSPICSKTIGVQVETIKSSPLKAAPSGFEPTSPEARKAVEEIVMDSYAWFKDLVQKRRSLDDATLAKVSDGRVFTGRQGLTLKLVDELGGERTAVAWLAKEKKIDPADAGPRLPAARPLRRPAVPAHRGDQRCSTASGWARSPAGFEELGAVQAMERLNLDGLLALWHPPSAN